MALRAVELNDENRTAMEVITRSSMKVRNPAFSTRTSNPTFDVSRVICRARSINTTIANSASAIPRNLPKMN